MAAAAVLNFGKVVFWATVTQIWWICTSLPNFKQISSLATEIWPKI